MREYSPDQYDNPDHNSYNVGALVLSVTIAKSHLREFQQEHPATVPEDDQGNDPLKPELPHAS